MIPYGRQYIDDDDIKEVIKVLKSDYLTTGPKVLEFEQKLAKMVGAQYAVAVNSGTAALDLAVKSLEISENKAGITSVNTFLASANCLIYNKLKPIFADIDPKTYNVSIRTIKEVLTDDVQVIIPVHFAGQPCKMAEIFEYCRKNKIYLIEDAAHAIGSKYETGEMVGSCSYSDLTTFSFHPVKTITTGEGGAITTNSEELYQKLLSLRSHGMVKDKFKNREEAYTQKDQNPWYYEMQTLGMNYRLADLAAALGISQLNKLDFFVSRRREIVRRYNDAFADLEYLQIPFEEKGIFSAFHLYVVLIDFKSLKMTRNQMIKKLRKQGILTQVHYIPLSYQPFYRENYSYNDRNYPNATKYYEKCLSLPLYPKMTDEEVEFVISKIKNLEGNSEF